MIFTTKMLLDKYKKYVDAKGKIARDVKNKKLFVVAHGLYETDENVSGEKLAQFIYGPSYLSFDYVLYQNSLIPEAVYKTFTCATCLKNKKKKYVNQYGTYLYQDVPVNVYPYGIEVKVSENYSYVIACKEKALCDKLYSISPATSYKNFIELLFSDLRLDEDDLLEMDKSFILEIAPMYHSKNLNFLVRFFKKKTR